MPKKVKTLKIRQIRHIDKNLPAACSSLGRGSHEAWRSLAVSLVVLCRVVWAKTIGKAEPYKGGTGGMLGGRVVAALMLVERMMASVEDRGLLYQQPRGRKWRQNSTITRQTTNCRDS